VEGVYNGPNHKSQPTAYPGDTIQVAGGPYAADLIKLGFVIASEDYVEPVADPIAPSQDDNTEDDTHLPVAESDAHAWSFWEAAGATNQLAQTIYDAGYTSPDVLVSRCETEGFDPLIAIKGIGQRRAKTIYSWAFINR